MEICLKKLDHVLRNEACNNDYSKFAMNKWPLTSILFILCALRFPFFIALLFCGWIRLINLECIFDSLTTCWLRFTYWIGQNIVNQEDICEKILELYLSCIVSPYNYLHFEVRNGKIAYLLHLDKWNCVVSHSIQQEWYQHLMDYNCS